MGDVISGNITRWKTPVAFTEVEDRAAHTAYWAECGIDPPWDYPPETNTFEPTSVDWSSINREFS